MSHSLPSDSFEDKRGQLLFPVKTPTDLGTICQCTVSKNKRNVFRGMHSNTFDKLVTCIQGRILDIIYNLDPEADDYLQPYYYTLDPATEQFKIKVPKNYAHGFLSLEEDSIVLYHFNGYFSADSTRHIHYKDPYVGIELPIQEPILSEKDTQPNFVHPIDYVILGSTGYLGGHITNILHQQGKHPIPISNRLSDTTGIRQQLELYKPKYLINAAGLTGTPNIDWCDEHKTETIETNVIYPLTLCHMCRELGIHLTLFGSGGIFSGEAMRSEEQRGDYDGKFYSEARIYLENMARHYPNMLYLRINYPLSSCTNPKNLLQKIARFTRVSNVSLSITCVDSLFPRLSEMIENRLVGVLNFVNPGSISLIDIKQLYNQYHGITDGYDICEPDSRSCPLLDTSRISNYKVESIRDAIIKILRGVPRRTT